MSVTEDRKRTKYIRRALLGALVFMTAMVQNVPWLPDILGARALPLLPLVVSIAILDQPVPAIVFGAFAGILWDFSVSGHGLHALYLTTVAFTCAMLLRYILNRNALTVFILSFFSSYTYIFLRWSFDYNLTGPSGNVLRPLLRYSLPSLAYTLLLLPACYALARLIVRKTSRRPRGVLAE